ncbi:MAG: alpha/beta hydrolase [Maricaulaceae bacterium]
MLRLLLTASLAHALLVSCAHNDPQKKPSKTLLSFGISALSPINIGESVKITSKHTGETHIVNIWTPPKMGKDEKTHPVLYVLDGGVDQDFQHIAGLAQLASISNRFDAPIVVGIRTSNRYYQLTPKMTDPRYLSWNGTEDNPESGGADDFHNYITLEVVPFVEGKYPVNSRKTLMGESLAGFYVAREFLRHPDGFTDYISISPSLWLDDQKLAKEAPALLATHDHTPRNLYFTMADEGGTMQAGLDKVLAAINMHAPENLNIIYVDRRDTDTHATIYHGAALDALIQFFGKPAPDYGEPPWYLTEGASPEG